MFVFPNWPGQTQPRVVKIEGAMLHLSSAAPIMSGGKKTMSYLSWRRAEPDVQPGQTYRKSHGEGQGTLSRSEAATDTSTSLHQCCE
jgi:hypothetical protein